VAEVELQHFEGPLDDERRIRVRYRAQTRERETARDTHHELLADSDIDHPIWMRSSRLPARAADLGDDDRERSSTSTSSAAVA